MYAASANLSVAGVSQLRFLLLVVGLFLAPGLMAFVPVVPRDACGSAPLGKSYGCFICFYIERF